MISALKVELLMILCAMIYICQSSNNYCSRIFGKSAHAITLPHLMMNVNIGFDFYPDYFLTNFRAALIRLMWRRVLTATAD